MSSGTVKFYVDGYECPDTLGVGVNAVGGVFNCDRWGSVFEARCTDVCQPAMDVIEMQIYVYSILTAEGTPYILDGNEEHLNDYGNSIYQSDLTKLWQLGSYYNSNISWDDSSTDQ